MKEPVSTSEASRDPLSDSDVFRELLRLAPGELDVPEDSAARTEAFLRARWRQDLQRSRRRALVWRSLAAAAGLAIVLGAVFWSRQLDQPAPIASARPVAILETVNGAVHLTVPDRTATSELAVGDAVPAGAVLLTGPADRAALRLAGGASLRLDGDSRLRLASAERLELEGGAVYFDSGDEAVPEASRVELGTVFGTVRDIGTQYEVRLQGSRLRLRVREGRVILGSEHEATAGEELVLKADGTVKRDRTALFGSEWGWILDVAPAFELDERPLSEFLRWVARETGWQVRLADGLAEAASEIVLYGDGSTTGLRPDEAPAVVLPTCGLRSRLEDGILHVERM